MKYDFDELMKKNMERDGKPSEILNQRVMCRYREVVDMKKKNIWRFPKVAAVVLCAFLATGGVVYAAANLFHWNRDVAEKFGVADNTKVMEDLSRKGFSDQAAAGSSDKGIVSVRDKDIQVKLLQTLADKQSAYVYYEVKYGNKYHAVDTGVAMAEANFKTGSGKELNYCGGISKIKDAHTVIYEYCLTVTDAQDFLTGETIYMSIPAFTVDRQKADPKPDVIARGDKWKLSWKLSTGTEKRVYHLNKKVKLGKYSVFLKDIELSPLSYVLTYQKTDGARLDEIAGVVKDTGEEEIETDENGNFKILRYVNIGDAGKEDKIMKKLPKGQKLCFLDNMQIFVDGKEFREYGGIGRSQAGKISDQFSKILDLKAVTGVRVAGKYIDLKSIAYDTRQ